MCVSRAADHGKSGALFATSEKDTGHFRIGPVPASVCHIWVQVTGFPQLDLGFHILEPDQTFDLGNVRLEQGGDLVVRLRRATGEPIGSPNLGLYRVEDMRNVDVLTLDGERAFSDPVAPGAYRLVVRDGPARPRRRVIQVGIAAGTTPERELLHYGSPR